jgi:AcrR family transcriptional regulator
MATMDSNISSRRLSARRSANDEYEKRRATIIAAAAALFKEKGFEATTVDDIARKADIDRASIYYYYKGKKELFREMVQEAMTGNVLMAEQIAASADPASTKLALLIEGLFESYERHYPYLFVFVQVDMAKILHERSAWSGAIRALSRRFDHAITAMVQQGIDDGTFQPRGDARLLAAGITGMCNWSHRWFEPGGKHDKHQIAKAFSDMVINGLAGARAYRKSATAAPRPNAS